MKKDREKRNQGFSLVELIVVVAIMGVALTVGSYALTTISMARAKNCANEMNEALARTRMESYSKDSDTANLASVSFYRGSDGIYMEKSYEGSPEKIGSNSISVAYKLKNAADYTDLGTEKLTFTFNRSSGAFRDVQLGGSSLSVCTSIKISSGGKTYTITCYPQTGKTKIE